MSEYDLVIRNGTVATAGDTVQCDVGVRDGRIVALGDALGDGYWSVRVRVKPFIRFIWFGAAIMAFGGLLAATDRRYRRRKEALDPVGAGSAATRSA